MSRVDQRRARSFGSFAEEYALWRPSYPAAAVEWLLPPDAARVADVGAGTGKLTGPLLDRGLAVEAVEPDPRMLQVLRRLHPAAAAHRAPAEALPLPDASVDAVLVADAWHWFPAEQALREARRVLRPGGWLGLVWNVPTPVERWEFELAGLDPDRAGLDKGDPTRQGPAPSFPAAETRTAAFPWTWELTPEHWRSLLATNSAVAALERHEREERLDRSRAVVDGVCRATGRATAPVRYEAYCVRWQPARRR